MNPFTLEQRARQGDPAALAEFLQQHRGQLLAYIEKHLGDALRRKIEPDDVLQEVSLECMRSLPRQELGDRSLFGWLCQVAERRIVDAHRRFAAQKRAADREVPLGTPGGETRQAGLINVLVASMTSPSKAFSRNQRQLRVQHALEQLPEELREALRLRYVENLPTKEIAQRLGKTDGAIRVLLSRTLRKLEEILGPPET